MKETKTETVKLTNVKVKMAELEKKRYDLLLRGIRLGLNKAGIKNISFSKSKIENDYYSFNIDLVL